MRDALGLRPRIGRKEEKQGGVDRGKEKKRKGGREEGRRDMVFSGSKKGHFRKSVF